MVQGYTIRQRPRRHPSMVGQERVTRSTDRGLSVVGADSNQCRRDRGHNGCDPPPRRAVLDLRPGGHVVADGQTLDRSIVYQCPGREALIPQDDVAWSERLTPPGIGEGLERCGDDGRAVVVSLCADDPDWFRVRVDGSDGRGHLIEQLAAVREHHDAKSETTSVVGQRGDDCGLAGSGRQHDADAVLSACPGIDDGLDGFDLVAAELPRRRCGDVDGCHGCLSCCVRVSGGVEDQRMPVASMAV